MDPQVEFAEFADVVEVARMHATGLRRRVGQRVGAVGGGIDDEEIAGFDRNFLVLDHVGPVVIRKIRDLEFRMRVQVPVGVHQRQDVAHTQRKLRVVERDARPEWISLRHDRHLAVGGYCGFGP